MLQMFPYSPRTAGVSLVSQKDGPFLPRMNTGASWADVVK